MVGKEESFAIQEWEDDWYSYQDHDSVVGEDAEGSQNHEWPGLASTFQAIPQKRLSQKARKAQVQKMNVSAQSVLSLSHLVPERITVPGVVAQFVRTRPVVHENRWLTLSKLGDGKQSED